MGAEKEISNWNNYPRIKSTVHEADDPKSLLSTEEVPTVIARGNGRCYGDASLNDQVLSTLSHNKIHDFDKETGIMNCDAGALLSELLEVMIPAGYFLPVTPGTKFVTVGGAIAADIHGKDHLFHGNFGQHVVSLELLIGDGSVVTCSPTENTALFKATCGGMGLTGIVLTAKFKCLPIESSFIEEKFIRTSSLKELAEQFEQNADWPYRVAWVDFTAKGAAAGRSLLLLGRFMKQSELPEKHKANPLQLQTRGKKNIPFFMPDFALSKFVVRLFNKWVYATHPNKTHIVDYDSYFYPLDAIHNWNRIYGKKGFVQYQLVLPLSAGIEAMQEVVDKIRASKYPPFLTVLKRFSTGEKDGLLSFPFEGWTLALDLKRRPGLFEFLQELDQLVLAHGGRLYLAKDARMSKEMFEATYPELDEFTKVVREVNKGKFKSHLAQRLGIYDSVS